MKKNQLILWGILVIAISVTLAFFNFLRRRGVDLDQRAGIPVRNVDQPEFNGAPYYFFAVHNEPFNSDPHAAQQIADDYKVLEKMVEKADQYHIKLTLMFTAQWADYIAASPERLGELKKWEQEGHEIAGHHHGLGHGNWDGYTNLTPEEALKIRSQKIKEPEKYIGTLEKYLTELRKIDPNVHTGCMNEEEHKDEMPKEIVYNTCSGFANFGPVGTRLADADPRKGKNDYVLAGKFDGVLHKWLSHRQNTDVGKEQTSEKMFSSLSSGEVFGVVNHSMPQEFEYFSKLLDFIHAQDPNGEKSRTVSEVIDQRLLPEKEIGADMLTGSSR